MSVYIDQVLDYLDDHLVCRCADGMESLLGMIHEAYGKHNKTDSEEIHCLLGEAGSILNGLSLEDAKAFLSGVCDLCKSYEQLAFSQGILVGMQLMTEINRLP